MPSALVSTSAVGSRNHSGVNGAEASLAKTSLSLLPPSMLTTALLPPIASTKALLRTTWLAVVSCARSSTSMLLTRGVAALKSKVGVLTTKLSVPVPPSMVSAASKTTWSLPVPASMLSAPAPPSITSAPAPAITVSLPAPALTVSALPVASAAKSVTMMLAASLPTTESAPLPVLTF